jgi:hypothetical protein
MKTQKTQYFIQRMPERYIKLDNGTATIIEVMQTFEAAANYQPNEEIRIQHISDVNPIYVQSVREGCKIDFEGKYFSAMLQKAAELLTPKTAAHESLTC